MGVFARGTALTKSVYNPLVASGDFSCMSHTQFSLSYFFA
jgi:hypothetical protein